MATRKKINKYVELAVGQYGRCRFIASLGGRWIRTSLVYASEADAMKDYNRGNIRWSKDKQKKSRFD